jgi:ParB family chromosome partitioning protein
MDEFHLKQDEIAEKVSKSRTAVTNSIRLLKLDERVQKLLINDEISAGHARTLLGLPDGDTQFAVAQRIIEEKLSVREIERLVKNILEPPKEKEKKTAVSTTEDVIYENLEERMKRIMGTKVSINRKKNNKGKIEIEYYSRDELERIIEMFESIE